MEDLGESAALAGEVLAVPREERGCQEGAYHESLGQAITANSVSASCAHCAGVFEEISIETSSRPSGIMAMDWTIEHIISERMKRLIASLLLVSRVTV